LRAQLLETLEAARVNDGLWAGTYGPYGLFILQGPCGAKLQIVGHPREGWEHVSVTTDRLRSPNWPEMCFVKDLFWDEEECVVQFHPPLSQYVKNHRYRLHLWKPKNVAIPIPPSSMVGIVGLDPEQISAFQEEVCNAGLTVEQTLALLAEIRDTGKKPEITSRGT
jgi:hypothetical protein